MLNKIYTRAEFFRLAQSGKLGLKMVRWYGKTKDEILADPAGNSIGVGRVNSGVFDVFRIITKVRSNDIQLEHKSWLDLPFAALMEFDGNSLRVYCAGFSPLSAAEKAVLDAWDAIANTAVYVEQASRDIMTDGSQTYWERYNFFNSRGMLHLLGNDWAHGRKLDDNRYADGEEDCVLDTSVRGSLVFEYEVRMF